MLEHPDDKKERLEAQAFAKVAAPRFFEEHREEFIDIVRLYRDDSALAMFESLRERFWSMDNQARQRFHKTPASSPEGSAEKP